MSLRNDRQRRRQTQSLIAALKANKPARGARKGGLMIYRRSVGWVLAVFTVLPCLSHGQAQSLPLTYLRCGTLIDEKSAEPMKDALVEIAGEKIRAVSRYSAGFAKPAGASLIELSSETCLPGLIDTHTHVLLQGDQKPGQYDEQILKWSLPYRAIRSTQSARHALEFGFTTIRDLETEGAYYADVALRDAIKEGIVPGPRMQVSTRALDVTGAYALLGYDPALQLPHGVQVIDGPYEARKAVREQIGNGADWIKFYADKSTYHGSGNTMESVPT